MTLIAPTAAVSPVQDTETVASALASVRRLLNEIDSRALLRHVTGCDEAGLIAHRDRCLTLVERKKFAHLAGRRAAGEPLAYLIGEREFFGRAFKTAPAVLIPRPETELLVEFMLEHAPIERSSRVLDLGTGSGCVAVSIACERPLARVAATDVSAAALEIAHANADAHGCANIDFICADWLAPLGGERFDIIVSNPPYVAAADPHLKQLHFEPALALAAGADGLDAIRVIVAAAPRCLVRGGWLAFEHGFDQAERCRALLRDAGLENVFSRRDLAGIERISGGCLRAGAITP